MPLNRSPLDTGTDRHPNRRTARLVRVAIVLALVGVGVVAVQRTGSGPDDQQTKGPERISVEKDDGRPDGLTGRQSAGLPLAVETGRGTAVIPEPNGQRGTTGPEAADPQRDAPGAGLPSRSGPGTSGDGPTTSERPQSAATVARPAARPSSGTSKPAVDNSRPPEERPKDQSAVPDPYPPVLVQPPAPAADEQGCPNLDLEPIGGSDPGEPLRKAFRALLPELGGTGDDLICGYRLEPWRDLTVQHLSQAGRDAGVIIAATDGSSIALRLAPNEWTGYRFRDGGAPTGFNFLGYPVGREWYGATEVVRTTTGGLVMPTPGTIGIPVIGGAWDVWMAHGGPSGDMGIPLSIPAGIPDVGAYQDFAQGRLLLPGVTTDIEAFSKPASAYEWHSATEFPLDPQNYKGKIIEVTGISFYIDSDGIAHLIATTADWMCATWDLGATRVVVPGYLLGSFGFGDIFDCPTR